MNKSYEDKYVRVRLAKNLFDGCEEGKSESEMAKEWILKGKKNSGNTDDMSDQIVNKLNIIEDRLDGLIRMNAWQGHHNLIMTALHLYESIYDPELIHEQKMKVPLKDIQKYSKSVCKSFFPELEMYNSLTNTPEWLKEFGYWNDEIEGKEVH